MATTCLHSRKKLFGRQVIAWCDACAYFPMIRSINSDKTWDKTVLCSSFRELPHYFTICLSNKQPTIVSERAGAMQSGMSDVLECAGERECC